MRRRRWVLLNLKGITLLHNIRPKMLNIERRKFNKRIKLHVLYNYMFNKYLTEFRSDDSLLLVCYVKLSVKDV